MLNQVSSITTKEAVDIVSRKIANLSIEIGNKHGLTLKESKEVGEMINESFLLSIANYFITGSMEPIIVVDEQVYKTWKEGGVTPVGLSGFEIPVIGDILGGLKDLISGVLGFLPKEALDSLLQFGMKYGESMLLSKLGYQKDEKGNIVPATKEPAPPPPPPPPILPSYAPPPLPQILPRIEPVASKTPEWLLPAGVGLGALLLVIIVTR